MSYLLDALRKAERERSLGRVPELSQAAGDAHTNSGKRIPRWVLVAGGVLVVLNMLALATFWWAGKNSSSPAQPTQTRSSTIPGEEIPAVNTEELDRRRESTALRADPEESSGRTDTEYNAAPIEPDPVEAEYTQPLAQPEKPVAQIPVPDNAPQYNALEPSERAQIPSLSVNGHLYSSIPGRSFVLINGRRYHEGQRVPEGPAIVLIDEQGAILKYRDISYRLDAPR